MTSSNLNSTTDFQDLGTINVIQDTNPPLISATETTSCSSPSIESDGVSHSSNDTIMLSSPESVSSQTSGHRSFQFQNFHIPIQGLPRRCTFLHPCLKEPGSFNGYYGSKQRLKYKMGNYRTQLKLQGCPELSVNSLKSKAPTDGFPAKKVKKPKNAEANFFPSLPTGEILESQEKERLELLTEIVIRRNESVIADKMAYTFAYRIHYFTFGLRKYLSWKNCKL